MRFRETGFDATTVVEICESADIAYGTLFNHFPTKLDLLRAIVDESQDTLAQNVEELAKEVGSMSDKLHSLFELVARYSETFGPGQRDLVAQMIALGYQESPADKDRRLHSIFRGFLESGVAGGEVCEEDLDALTEILFGAYSSLTLGWVHFDDYPLAARAQHVAALLSRILKRT